MLNEGRGREAVMTMVGYDRVMERERDKGLKGKKRGFSSNED